MKKFKAISLMKWKNIPVSILKKTKMTASLPFTFSAQFYSKGVATTKIHNRKMNNNNVTKE
jgi:hypothetical protein